MIEPLDSVPSLVTQHATSHGRIFDVFISHASEDKDVVVRPLASILKSKGLDVWFDDFELAAGDSLRRRVDHGLANSRFGVVVLSRSFLSKQWPNYELDGIVARSNSGEQVMLPIWHDITREEIIKYSPSIADKVARSTDRSGLDEIAQEIFDVIRSKPL